MQGVRVFGTAETPWPPEQTQTATDSASLLRRYGLGLTTKGRSPDHSSSPDERIHLPTHKFYRKLHNFDRAPPSGGLSSVPRCLVAGVVGGNRLSIADGLELRHGCLGEVAAFAGLPLVGHVGQDSADQADK